MCCWLMAEDLAYSLKADSQQSATSVEHNIKTQFYSPTNQT